MRKRVAVLLATYNGESWISAQIDSVLSQSHVEISIFVADDKSTDGTRKIIQAYSQKFSNIICLDFDESSGSACANFLRILSSVPLFDYDYVAFCDQDDLWEPWKIERGVASLLSSGCGGYSANTLAFWESGRATILSQSPNLTAYDFIFEGAGQGCSFVLNRQLALTVRDALLELPDLIAKFDFHDWLIYAIARSTGTSWFFDPECVLRYRQHSKNEIGARYSFRGIFHRLSHLKNGWYRNQVQILIEIISRLSFLKYSDVLVARNHLEGARSGALGRVKLSVFLLFQSRRKLTERVFLALGAILGWIYI